MDISNAILSRHSVRAYTDKAIETQQIKKLQTFIDMINKKTGMHFQVTLDEEKGFSGAVAHSFNFRNVKNYIALVAREGLDREVGYYGEAVVLFAQMLGLNTCWVARTFNKRKAVYNLNDGEMLYIVISLGYGENQGVSHKSKAIGDISNLNDNSPEWYKNGIEAVILAPTAMNRQDFYFSLADNKVTATQGNSSRAVMDLGIAQCHFDIATRKNNFDIDCLNIIEFLYNYTD